MNMIRLTPIGLRNLKDFIEENGTDRVREAYAGSGEAAWIDSIDDDGFLEMQGRYTKTGQPVTTRFLGFEQFENEA
jgi:hypothetical protein